MSFWMDRSYAVARRIALSVIGATLLLLGAVLLVMPGPGILVISMGLGVLALEFAWARSWLRKLRDTATEAGRAAGISGSPESGDQSSTSSSRRL